MLRPIRSGAGGCREQNGTGRGAPVDGRRVGAVTRSLGPRVRRGSVPGDCEPPQRMRVEQVPTVRSAGGLLGMPFLPLSAELTGERDDVHRDGFPPYCSDDGVTALKPVGLNCPGSPPDDDGGCRAISVDGYIDAWPPGDAERRKFRGLAVRTRQRNADVEQSRCRPFRAYPLARGTEMAALSPACLTDGCQSRCRPMVDRGGMLRLDPTPGSDKSDTQDDRRHTTRPAARTAVTARRFTAGCAGTPDATWLAGPARSGRAAPPGRAPRRQPCWQPRARPPPTRTAGPSSAAAGPRR